MFKAASLVPGVVLALLLMCTSVVQAEIGFAENQSDRIRLWNADYFELAFRKADGRLLYIVDKTTGQQVSPGNVHGPWVLRFSNGIWLDGENFSPTSSSRRFTYSWDEQESTLTLDYVATGTYACHVTVAIVPSDGPEVDTTLTITSQSNYEIELLAYPVQLSFARNQIDAVYVPYMEGMRLLPSFFASYDFSAGYPGRMFSDFAYTALSTGSFAVYALHEPQTPLKPDTWGILRDDSYAGGVNKYHHDYDVAIGLEEQWQSPTTVLSVGTTLDEAMASYWTRSGNSDLPTLSQKLAAPLLEKLANAVLLKRDFLQGSWTFTSFRNFLSNIPADNLLHIVAFWPNGFDENYPDYLPPNPSLGTLADLQNLVAYARSTGHLVMPYTNPTWWDDQSPTLASLGTGIVSRDRSGSLIYENYGAHGGYVVSPYSPTVIARQDQTRDEFTQTVPCDLLFEDQIGARNSPAYGAHPDCPDPVLYLQGLADVAARSLTWMPIMSEGGYDRLARFETGYCLSLTIGWHWWPDSTFTPYPMTQLWAHKNLYFGAHNLAGTVMARDLPKLTYYVSMGYSLSYDLSSFDADWLAVLDCFQKHLVSDMVGVGMTSFENLPTSGQTRTSFDNGTVITANLTGGSMTQGNHVIASNGFLVEQGGDVLGGVLTTLHGQALSGSSPHYLAIDHADYRIRIYQPHGDNGAIVLPRPASWVDDEAIQAVAVNVAGGSINRMVTITSTTLGVDYLDSIAGQDIRCFEITYCRVDDADCDGDIDSADFAYIETCMAGPDATPPDSEACLQAFDADVDLDVDLQDFALFQEAFTGGD